MAIPMLKCTKEEKESVSMKRNDYILILGIFIISVLSFIGFQIYSINDEQCKVQITVDGDVLSTVPLNKNQEIHVGEHNFIVIKDGMVYMKEADCPDKLCVHQNTIDSTGESIICLPNKVIVTIIGCEDKKDNGYDVTSD